MLAKEEKRRELVQDLHVNEINNQAFRIAKQMAKERQDIVGASRCLKDASGNLLRGEKEIKNLWKNHMEKK